MLENDDNSETSRFSIRLESKYLHEIDDLKRDIEGRSGFKINRTQMVRRLILEGLKSFKEGKITF